MMTLRSILLATLVVLTCLPVSAKELEPGQRGPQVKELQEALANHGYDPGLVDGVYGNRTRNAVRGFQLEHGLPATGLVDEITWATVFAANSAPVDGASGDDDSTEESISFGDDFDLSDWGMGGGDGTSFELGGYLQSSAAYKLQDSDLRFPSLVSQGQQIYFSANDEASKMAHQQNFAELWLDGNFSDKWSGRVAVDVLHYGGAERPFDDDVTVEIDEAYAAYIGDNASWSFGKEKINWGVMEVISPFNVINSANLMEPFVNSGLHDQQGQWTIHYNREEVDEYRFEALFIPVWNQSQVPQARTSDDDLTIVESDQWVPPIFSSVPTLVYIPNAYSDEWGTPYTMVYGNEFLPTQEPAKDLESMAFAARGLKTVGRYDLGAYFITTLDPKPSIEMNILWGLTTIDGIPGNVEILNTRIHQEFPRITVIGGSAETVSGRFRLKQETAFSYGRKSFPDITTNEGQIELFRRVQANSSNYTAEYTEAGEEYGTFHLLFGGEYTIPDVDIITSMQIGYSHKMTWEDYYFGEQDQVDVTLYGQKSLAQDQLTASLSLMWPTNSDAMYFSPRLSYVPTYKQDLQLTVGANVFTGDSEEVIDGFSTYSSTLGSYQNYSSVFASAKLLFGLPFGN